MTKISISPDEWAEMLRAARVPEPWNDPDAPSKFAEEISWAFHGARAERTIWTRRKAAIDELRRVLPEIIEGDEWFLEICTNPTPKQKSVLARANADPDRLSRELQINRRLLQALPDREPPIRKHPGPSGKAWLVDAQRLFGLYLKVIDPNSGASGPAVRFIEAALRQMGHSYVLGANRKPRGTIARALQRWRKGHATKNVMI
jgi:hypothetical protein